MTKALPKPALPTGALSRLRAELEFLSPSLRRVADHVLEHPERVVYQTITELADAAQVGEASITRLSHRLEFPGFHAFKLALTADLAGSAPVVEYPEASSTFEIIASAARQAGAALDDTRSVIDPGAVERVAQAIGGAPRVDVVGQGISGLAAQFMAHKLMRLGVTCLAHTDPHVAAVSASTLPKEAVLLAFTRSGSTLDTIQTMRLARTAGAFTAAVTNRATSPVRQYAQEVLYTASPEGPLSGGAISSLVSQVLVVEALYLTIMKHAGHAAELIRLTAESVVEKKI